jgi:prepilin-type N-terminal cleavage/methylation domain-containing protein
MFRRNRQARGVTLIELIVGILLAGVAFTLILMFIDKVRVKANFQTKGNRLRRIGEAVHIYHDVYQSFPSQPKPKDK